MVISLTSHIPQMIIRAHECVMDGFERFAAGQLITVFSATNYCGTANNAGAILVLGRDLVRSPHVAARRLALRFSNATSRAVPASRPCTVRAPRAVSISSASD